MNQNYDLSQLIRECRMEAHLSQYKLAEMLGVRQVTIYRWETGLSVPNARNQAKLITVFQLILRRETSGLAILKQVQSVKPLLNEIEIEMPIEHLMLEKMVSIKNELHKVNDACKNSRSKLLTQACS